MSAANRVYERLIRANPLTDTDRFQPTTADAVAFAHSLEERPMDSDTLVHQPSMARISPSRLAIAAMAFVAVVAFGAVALLLNSGDGPGPLAATAPPTTTATTEARPSEVTVDEPAELADLRQSVDAGRITAAAAIHGQEGNCDRFFTTGRETCEDWYAFLVGIGTSISAADCIEGDDGISCEWTIDSDIHQAFGIEQVKWEFTRVRHDGWTSVFPDHNLLTGIPGESALDEDFWAYVSEELVREDPGLGEPVRVPATLNADFASFVIEAATSFAGS